MAKRGRPSSPGTARLADAGKGTVAKLHWCGRGVDRRLADAGKGTVAKRDTAMGLVIPGLADAGKGTVAKPVARPQPIT